MENLIKNVLLKIKDGMLFLSRLIDRNLSLAPPEFRSAEDDKEPEKKVKEDVLQLRKEIRQHYRPEVLREIEYKEANNDTLEAFSKRCAEIWDQPCQFSNAKDRLNCLIDDLKLIEQKISIYKLALLDYVKQADKETEEFAKAIKILQDRVMVRESQIRNLRMQHFNNPKEILKSANTDS